MKWYYGGINIKKYDYDINEKLTSHYNVSNSFYINEYDIKNIKYIEATNIPYTKKKIEESDLILFGDIDIKNINELRERYKLDNKSDFEIVKFLYKNKGIEFINDLYGGFSLVIIDYTKNTTYLIRDQIGEKELYWGIIDKRIFFGSDLFLIENFYNKNILNLQYFKLYCENLGYTDFTLTPYKNIFRVNSGSYIEINMNNFKSSCKKYWKLEWIKNNYKLNSEEEYVKKFKELLIDNINNITSKNKVNALALSGGLDSTAIFALTKKYTNNTIEPYCGIFEELLDCDERQYINETMNMYNQEVNYVNCDECGVLINYPEDYFCTSEPHINILNKRFSEKLYSKVQQDNIKSLCDGFFADHILTGNIMFLLDNKINRKEKYRIVEEFSRSMNLNLFQTIYRYLILPKINKAYIPEVDENLLKYNKSDLMKVDKYSNKDIILQIKAISSNFFGDRELAPRYNIECFHPFVDRKIIEFLYNTPGELRLNGEVSKYILRKAIKDIIPEKILQRISKTQHVELTQKGLRDNWNKIFNKLKIGRITKIPYIKLTQKQWVEELLKFRSGQTSNDNMYIYLSLEVWLQQLEDKYGKIIFE